MISTQFSAKIKGFRSSSGGSYISAAFRTLLASHGTVSQRSCPHTPQQNGVAERKHRHITLTARSLLLSLSLVNFLLALIRIPLQENYSA